MPFCGGASRSDDQIFHGPELHNLSVTYPLGLTDTTYNLSEKFPNKLTADIHSHPEIMPIMYHEPDKILEGMHIPIMAFTSCHNWGLNRTQPSNESLDT